MWSSQQTPALSTLTSGATTPRRPWSVENVDQSCIEDIRHVAYYDDKEMRTESLRDFSNGRQGYAREALCCCGIGAPSGFVRSAPTTNDSRNSTYVGSSLRKRHGQQCCQESSAVPLARASARSSTKQRSAVIGRVRRLFSISFRSQGSGHTSKDPSIECSRGGRSRSNNSNGMPMPERTRILREPLGTRVDRERSLLSSSTFVTPAELVEDAPPSSVRGNDLCCHRPRSDGRLENFHRALKNKLVEVAFRDFCTRSLCVENLDFVQQVRELDELAADESTTSAELRERISHVAENFVRPESASEVNVKGSSRDEVLCTIQAAIEAGKARGGGDSAVVGEAAGNGEAKEDDAGAESPLARVLAVAATESLVSLSHEVHLLILDGLWPRFLISNEFALMMNHEDMRTAGFVGLAGEVIVSALPARPPTAKQPRRRTARSMTRRDLSKALSFRSTARSSAASTTTTTTTTTLATNGTALVVAKEDTARSRVAAAPPLLGSISLVSTIGNPSGADHLDEDTNANMGDTVAADRRHARVEYNASLSPTRRRCRPSIAAPTRGGGGALGGGRGNESRGGARLGGIPVWRAGAGNRGAAVDSAFGSMTGGIAGHENWSWGTSRRAFSLR